MKDSLYKKINNSYFMEGTLNCLSLNSYRISQFMYMNIIYIYISITM